MYQYHYYQSKITTSEKEHERLDERWQIIIIEIKRKSR